MDQYLIEQPCRYIALRPDGSLRFHRSTPAHPAWMVALWQRDYLTGWVCPGPYGANWIAMALGAVWQMEIPSWPLPRPTILTIDVATLQLEPDLRYLLDGSGMKLREAGHLADQAGQRLADFEWFLSDLTDQMQEASMPRLTYDDTCWMATEFGYFVPVGRQRGHPRRDELLLDLARANARE